MNRKVDHSHPRHHQPHNQIGSNQIITRSDQIIAAMVRARVWMDGGNMIWDLRCWIRFSSLLFSLYYLPLLPTIPPPNLIWIWACLSNN